MANTLGKLIICPTPIGNLGDMTERTVSALGEADVVCAEDTRVTGKLLAAFGIEKRLERLDEALIGGIRIFDNGTMIDGTVLGRLGAVRAKLLHTVQAQEDSHGS